MGLSSIFKRSHAASAAAPGATGSGDPVQEARTRARRRLIGAAVLLVIGVLGFPLIFETRPRPVPIDIPIEIPKKDAVPPLAMPAPRSPSAVPADTADTMITESKVDAGREIASRGATPSSATASDNAALRAPRSGAASGVAASPPGKPAAAVALAASEPGRRASGSAAVAANGDAARARALLEARPVAPATPASQAAADAGARFVVQVGAFAENGAARETRAKMEKLGLKTYTQVAQTQSGNRIRVRVGPFATRAEADAALAKARAAGLNAVVLTL